MRVLALLVATLLCTSLAFATDANMPAGAIAHLGNDRFHMPPRMTTPAPGHTPYAIPRAGLALCWPGDGKEILWADTGGQFVAWDANTGQARRTFDIGRSRSGGACFSADGKFLCSASVEPPGSVTFWSTADGKQAGTYSSGAKTYLAAMMPAGQARFLLHAGRPPYHVYDAAAGKAVAVLNIPANNIGFTSAAAAPDGTAVAVTGFETKSAAGGVEHNSFIQVLDVPSGKQRFRTESAATGFAGTAVAFMPDGKHLLHFSQGVVQMLSAADGKEVKKLQTSLQHGLWMICSPDGKYVAVGGSTMGAYSAIRMEVLDLTEGKTRCTLPMTASYVRAAFSPDSRSVALTTSNGSLLVADAATGRQIGSTGHCGGVTGLDISPDGKTLASVGADCCTYLWRLPEGKVIRGWFGADTPVGRVAFSRDGRLVVVSANSQAVRFYDVATGNKIGQVDAAMPVSDLFRWPGRDTFAIRKQMSLGEVIPATGKEGRDIAVANNTYKIAIRPDGAALFVAGLQGQIAVCDANSGTQTHGIPVQGAMSQLDLTGDGLLLAVGGSQPGYARTEVGASRLAGRVELLETATGKSIATITLGGTLAFSPDGRLLAIGQNDGAVRLWSLLEAKDVAEFRGHTSTVSAVKWTPDGKALATCAADGQIFLWDTAKLAAAAAAPAAGKLYVARLKALYAELGVNDATNAFAAVRELARGGAEARTFLIEQLAAAVKPAADAGKNRVDELIANLDSPKFAVRKAANDELTKLGDAALPALHAALKRTDLSAETRARLEALTAREVKAPIVSKDSLVLVRALLALRLNDPAAGAEAAAKLAAGDPAAEITPLAATVNACIKTTAADRGAWRTAPTTAPSTAPAK